MLSKEPSACANAAHAHGRTPGADWVSSMSSARKGLSFSALWYGRRRATAAWLAPGIPCVGAELFTRPRRRGWPLLEVVVLPASSISESRTETESVFLAVA